MIIDSSYFKDELRIEGLSSYSGAESTKRVNKEVIESYIERYERNYIFRILGKNMGNLFIEYLKSGEEKNDEFEGLKKMLTEFRDEEKTSPIAHYVFFHFVRRCVYSVSMIGVTKMDTDNPLADPTPVLVYAWNEMCRMNEEVLCYLKGCNMWKDVLFDAYMVKNINVLGI